MQSFKIITLTLPTLTDRITQFKKTYPATIRLFQEYKESLYGHPANNEDLVRFMTNYEKAQTLLTRFGGPKSEVARLFNDHFNGTFAGFKAYADKDTATLLANFEKNYGKVQELLTQFSASPKSEVARLFSDHFNGPLAGFKTYTDKETEKLLAGFEKNCGLVRTLKESHPKEFKRFHATNGSYFNTLRQYGGDPLTTRLQAIQASAEF